jgi:hypothetical protein
MSICPRCGYGRGLMPGIRAVTATGARQCSAMGSGGIVMGFLVGFLVALAMDW